MINEILDEIYELNHIDNKSVLERFIKYNEEFGEFNAEYCKFLGITHKPYDKEHLIEEMADTLQNLFSIYLAVGDECGFVFEDVIAKIYEKNDKWRDKIPHYVKNQLPRINLSELYNYIVIDKVEGDVEFVTNQGLVYRFNYNVYYDSLLENRRVEVIDIVGDLNRMVSNGFCELI